MGARPHPKPRVAEFNADEFVLATGRLPQLGVDPNPPWRYRGYLLYYLQLGDRAKAPEVIDRWNWYMQCVQERRLIDEPIPQIEFGHEGRSVDEGSAGHREIEKWIDIVYDEIGSMSAFSALLDWLMYGFGLTREYPRLSEKTQEALYRNVNLEPVLKHPYDYLGGIYCNSRSKRWNTSGFYPTPHVVVDMMTRMVMHDVSRETVVDGKRILTPDGRDPRTLTVCDPCVGSGRMLLHASNLSVCLYGMDIDSLCCAMSKINAIWYAPWMVFPFPQSIIDRPIPPPAPASLEDFMSDEQKAQAGFTLIEPTPHPIPPKHVKRPKVYRIDDKRQPRLF
jgi:hypothetical protein